MRIRAAQVHEMGGSIPAPVASARTHWSARTGLLLRLRDTDGLEGLGEASPLPGYSVDTLPQARACLRAVPWDQIRVDERADVLAQVGRALAHVPFEVPSARFAVETALLDLLGQRRGRPLHRMLAPEGEPAPIPLCALVHSVDDAQDAVRRGFTALKLKVGAPPEAEIHRVQAVRRAAGGAVALRLDGNRTWPETSWLDTIARLSEVGPEWIEEPVSSAAVQAAWLGGRRPAVALAADESLRTPADRSRVRVCTDEGVYRAWVLKPMVLGGGLACRGLAQEARGRGAAVVVSHLFDGPVALAAARALALALGDAHAAGLASHAALAAFPGADAPQRRVTRIVAPAAPGLGVQLDPGSAR